MPLQAAESISNFAVKLVKQTTKLPMRSSTVNELGKLVKCLTNDFHSDARFLELLWHQNELHT